MENSRFPLLMKSAAAGTALLTLLFILVYRYFPINLFLVCAISLGTTAYHFVMRLAVGYLIPKLTGYDFDYHHRWFQPRKWEPSFYKTIHIRKWKNTLPTYAPELYSIKENSLHRIIQNMCGAEIVHEVIMVLSFLPLLTVPVFGSFPVFFITSLLASFYDGIFVIAQRYNRPRLVRIYEKQEAKLHE